MHSGNTGKSGRKIIALAAAAVVGSVATDAMAQLNYGDAVTINSFLNTSQSGRIYRVQPNGQQTQIGSDWGWNERPLAVLVENRNTVLVATGTYYNANSGYTPRLYRVDVATGDRTQVAAFNFNGSTASWQYQPTDLERNPVTGKVYVSTGIPYWSTGQSSGRIHEINTQTGNLTTIVDNLGWNRSPTQMAIDPTDPTKMKFAATYQADSYESYHYTVDLTNPSGTLQNPTNRGWSQRVQGLEYSADGTLYGTWGTMYSSGNDSYFSTNDENNLNPTSNLFNFSSQRHGWPSQAYKLAYDEENNRMWIGGAQHYNSNGSYSTAIYTRDLTNNSNQFIVDNNNQWGVVDLDVLTFGFTATGQNDLVIGTTDSNITGSGNFYSNNPTGELSATTLLTALASGNASARNGYQNASGEDGDVTVNADLDFNGVGTDKTLTIRAHDDLTINNTIADSDAADDVLTLVLAANNGGEAGATGAVDINAEINTAGGNVSISGKSFDNTDGAINAGDVAILSTDGNTSVGAAIVGGAVTLNTTGDTSIDASVSGTSILLTSTGSTSVNATVEADDITITTNGLSTTADIAASNNLTLNNTGSLNLGGQLVAGGQLSIGSSTMDIENGSVVSAGSLATGGTYNVNPDGSLNLGSLPSSIPAINVQGGTLTLDPGSGNAQVATGSNFNFSNGTVIVAGNQSYTPSNGLGSRVMGTSLTVGKTVEVTGNLTLGTTYTLNGGTLKVGALLNGYNLAFTKGTLEFTAQDVEVTDGGVLGDTVVLTSGQNVVASGISNGNVNVSSDGILELAGGRLTANAVNNAGELRLNSSNSRISGGSLANDGILSGTGRVETEVLNNSTGEIRAAAGNQLRFTNSVQNDGRIDVQGGTAEFASTLTNTGEVVAHNGTLRFGHGSINAVFNSGAMNITGQTNVYGDVYNAGGGGVDGGTIIVSGGATVNFYDDVYNGPDAAADHELRVGGGSAIVVFGTYHGGGATGQGTVHMEGGFEPAYSPGAIDFGGNLALGQNAETSIELAGASLGSFDQVNVAGQLVLDGDLNVEFLNGYLPADGTVFNIFNASSVVGAFDNVTFSRGVWDVSYTPTGVSLTAISVPEPATLGVLATGAAGLLRRRRRVA